MRAWSQEMAFMMRRFDQAVRPPIHLVAHEGREDGDVGGAEASRLDPDHARMRVGSAPAMSDRRRRRRARSSNR